MILFEYYLAIESIYVRGAAIQEQEDKVLRRISVESLTTLRKRHKHF